MIVTRRLTVTLGNGRSHILLLPEGVDPDAAGEALSGLRSPAEVGWPEGAADWLRFDEGAGWVRRTAIAEVVVVDWIEQSTENYG